jgi:ribosomal protein S18 acetylase RimI-like enzyme
MDQIFKRQVRSHPSSGELIEVSLQKLTPEQIEGVRSIAQGSFDKVWSEKEFDYFISHPSGFCWGVFHGGTLIAYFLGLLVQGELDIVSVAVSNNYRRCSVAEELLAFIWDFSEIRKAFLEVEAQNIAAIKLYEKCSFQNYGLRKKFYAGIKDAVLMKKEKG